MIRIDREKLTELLKSNQTLLVAAGTSATATLRLADHLIAHGVTIPVRCKDCTYWDKAVVNKKGFLIYPASGMEIMADDYCSYGERRTE